ncbi:MAG: chromosome segregation protein SMC [Candidatus Nanoarchaeia archaeon]|nr:chromosome segregation protein SMC [Candidatus Nanoarchaeia archaeon]MDD5053881.1 chromosome segregation protein SMC [Candidatus Nanoarchaeia archaeon]
MVKIKKIIIENFKSFGGKNEIKFMDNLNLIIGPNGSGKSNISEAISFVLGIMSKKNLRTEKLSHLIFNGGKSGKPANSASVKIVFSNEKKVFPVEEDFVEISRKVNSDGSSDYLINGKKTTRTEILNLLDYAGLSPEGFNMIMQGSIAKFVDMSSFERAEIIKDISGISTYEEKKEKALKELVQVEQKIKETNILLRERQKHLDELKKEKRVAEQFKSAKEELRETKGRLSLKNLDLKKSELGDAEKKRDEFFEKIRKKTSEINELSSKSKILQSSIDALNKNLGLAGAEKKKELDDKIKEVKDEITLLETNSKSHLNEISRIKSRDAQITVNINEYEKEAEKIRQELLDYKKDIEKINNEINKHKADASSNKEINYFEIKSRINEIKGLVVDKKSKRDELKNKSEDLSRLKESQEDLSSKESLLESVYEKLENEMSINSELALKLEQSLSKISELKTSIEKINIKKDIAMSRGGGGLKELLASGIDGIFGTIMDLCKADSRYELPLRIALGPKMMNVVVRDEVVANECVKFLRANKLGVVTFLPLSKIKGYSLPKGLRVHEGVIEFAINLVDFNPKYKNIFEYALKDSLVIKDFECAKKVGIGNARMITLQGDLIEKSGSITGGYRTEKPSASLSTKTGSESIEALSIELSKHESIKSRLSASKTDNDNNIMSLREKRASLETEILNLKKMIEGLVIKCRGFDAKLLERLENEISELDDELVLKNENAKDYEKTFNPETFEKTKKMIGEYESKLTSLTVNKGIKASRLKQLESKELDELREIKKDLQKQLKKFEEEFLDFKNRLDASKKQLSTYLDEEKGFEEKLRENYAKKDGLEEELKAIKLKIEENKIHIKDFEEKTNNYALLIAELKGKIEGLEIQFNEYKDLELKVPKKSVSELEHEIFMLEKKLESFGNVNLKALEVFKIVEEEYSDVREKMDLLENESNNVKQAMNEIELKKNATFMETFKEIESNFERIFSIMSPGGIADMILEDSENPIEGGVDIKARPKGKKFLTLKSMSGGEKTITALSFIFAIQEYNPAPFYIMDEVEAALDKENATLFAKLCKQYSEKAQFIVISHNDNVISEADYLYGVSMDTNGVSKVVTLKLD